MALDAKVGSFNITTGMSDVQITGVGFQPTFVMFWFTGETSSVDAIASGDIYHGKGFMAASTQGSVCSYSQHNVSTTNGADGVHNASAISMIDGGDAFVGRANFKSFDADGFTLAIADAFPVNLRIHYLALGGASLTGAHVGTLTRPGSTGTQDITGVGFNPNLVLFVGPGARAGIPYDDAGAPTTMIGWADGTANERVSSVKWGNGNANESIQSYQFAGECIADDNFNGPINRAELSAFITDGFRLNWLEVTASSPDGFLYAALLVDSVKSGTLNTRTDGADIAVTGVGFKPSAVLFAGQARAQNAQDTGDNTSDGRMSVGAASSPTARAAAGFALEDAAAVTHNERWVEHDAVYAASDLSAAIQEAMDLKSMDSDGFTCVMDDPAASATPVYYLALGPAAAAGGGFVPFAPQMWRSGFGRDPYAGRPVASRRRRRRSA